MFSGLSGLTVKPMWK